MFSLIPVLGLSLRVLDLSSCVALTNRTLQAICAYLTHLSVLRMAWCKELQDWGLLGLGEPSEEPMHEPQVQVMEGGRVVPGLSCPPAPPKCLSLGIFEGQTQEEPEKQELLPTATSGAGASGLRPQGPFSPSTGPFPAHAAGPAGVGPHSLQQTN